MRRRGKEVDLLHALVPAPLRGHRQSRRDPAPEEPVAVVQRHDLAGCDPGLRRVELDAVAAQTARDGRGVRPRLDEQVGVRRRRARDEPHVARGRPPAGAAAPAARS